MPPVLLHATDLQLEQAIAWNHLRLFCDKTAVAGGEIVETPHLTYTHLHGDGSIFFPALKSIQDKELQAMMDFFRMRKVSHIGCWSLHPPTPEHLGAWLLARGFQPGWRARWMSADLGALPAYNGFPPNVEIKANNNISIVDLKDLPYSGSMPEIMFTQQPEKVQRFVALLNGERVGHCCVYYTTGELGIAGVYNVGVLPSVQGRGIGQAIITAACMHAREKGYRYAMLNANDIGWHMYERCGFRVVGYGITWWLVNDRYFTDPPAPEIVQLAEAVGAGDVATLQQLHVDVATLNTPITNGMTLMSLSAHCKQPAAAEWLVQQGASFTALEAWDLGWPERAAELMATGPEEANRRYFNWKGTLLHVAVERNDIALAKLALEGGVDIQIEDGEHHSKALGWAHFFRREAIIKLIESFIA